MRNWFLYIVLPLVILSCKKAEEQENVVDRPDFYVEGAVDGQSLKLEAGNNDYYMFTSSSQNSDDVNYYSGRLAKANCNSCGGSLFINFRGEKKEVTNPPVLAQKMVDFTLVEPKLMYGVQFNTDKTFTSRANSVNYSWDLGDGTQSQEVNPYHLFGSEEEFYDVHLLVNTSKGVPSDLNNKVYTSTECKTWFELVNTFAGRRLVAKHEGGVPKQYFWEFEDGTTASVAELDYDFDALNGSEKICLTITDENGCVSQSCQNLVVNEDFAFTAANFEYEIREVHPKNGFDQYNTVSIEYTDDNGVTYFSEQSENLSSVQIFSVEDYPKKNELGQTVKRVEFAVSCDLVSLTGKKIRLENVRGFFGVAVPE